MQKTIARTLLCISAVMLMFASCSDQKAYKIGVSQCAEGRWREKVNNEMLASQHLYECDVKLSIAYSYDDTQLQIRQIDSLANTGIDLLVVGPNDLSASYGLLGKTRDPRMMEVYDHVAEVCKAHKMPFGVSLGAGDLESAREWLDRGIAFLSCGDDISYMDMGCRMTFDFVDKYKQEKGG